MKKIVNGAEVDCTPAEEAERAAAEAAWADGQTVRDAVTARLVADETERAAARGDGTILTIINQTRAEWQTWAGTNFPTLTVPERNRMGTICWLLSVAVRRQTR